MLYTQMTGRKYDLLSVMTRTRTRGLGGGGVGVGGMFMSKVFEYKVSDVNKKRPYTVAGRSIPYTSLHEVITGLDCLLGKGITFFKSEIFSSE